MLVQGVCLCVLTRPCLATLCVRTPANLNFSVTCTIHFVAPKQPTVTCTVSGSWIRAAEYMVIIYIIPGHLPENTVVMQLLHKVVGVNSRIPRVHGVGGGSLLLLGSGLVVCTCTYTNYLQCTKFYLKVAGK